MSGPHSSILATTPLHGEHVAAKARMVPFAGYDMPVQYALGVLREHQWTRAHAGLFDVSHMGQAVLRASGTATGEGAHRTVAQALETLVPAALVELAPGAIRYSQLLDETGGILDDLMISRPAEASRQGELDLVVNASRKADDFALLRARLAGRATLEVLEDRALLALQGPSAEAVLEALMPGAAALRFMTSARLLWEGGSVGVARSGYTGEDGYEISVPAVRAVALWRRLAASGEVQPVGLGARDSLRLEAGLCLYGSDIDPTTSPVEAALAWSIQKVRRQGGARAGGFPGAARVLAELTAGPSRSRVGLRPEGKAPVRGGARLFATESAGDAVGVVTSGGFGPSVDAPVAMGYLPAALAVAGARVWAEVRGSRLPVVVCSLPFITPGYKR